MLEECIACHHHIEQARHYPREVALVHIANVIAQMAELDSLEPDDVEAVNPLAWEITGLDQSSIEPAMREAQDEIAEIEKLFLDM